MGYQFVHVEGGREEKGRDGGKVGEVGQRRDGQGGEKGEKRDHFVTSLYILASRLTLTSYNRSLSRRRDRIVRQLKEGEEEKEE